jgi:multimeric flavodoxin WrbA
MKFLCISGSPIKGGNTFLYIQKAIEPIKAEADIEIIELADKEVSDCVHCDWCLANRDADRICRLKDDGQAILKKIKEADILLLASPTYFGRMTGRVWPRSWTA